jgi:hypothetical protein
MGHPDEYEAQSAGASGCHGCLFRIAYSIGWEVGFGMNIVCDSTVPWTVNCGRA